MKELDLPELTGEQTEKLCSTAEEAARKHVLSKISAKKIETLNVCAEVDGSRPLKLTVDVDVTLSTKAGNVDVQNLADEAVGEAFKSAERYLRELKCRLPT